MSVSRDEISSPGDGPKSPRFGWLVLVGLVLVGGVAGLPVMWWWPELGGVLHWLVTVVAMVLEIVRQRRPNKS